MLDPALGLDLCLYVFEFLACSHFPPFRSLVLVPARLERAASLDCGLLPRRAAGVCSGETTQHATTVAEGLPPGLSRRLYCRHDDRNRHNRLR